MARSSIRLAALLLAAGCKSTPAPEPRDLVQDHIADARAATTGEAASPGGDLTDFEQKVLKIRDDWQKKLVAPERILTFYDFSTPAMAALRAEAAREDFPLSLAKSLTLERVLAGAFVRNPDLLRAGKELAATIDEYAQVTYLDTILRQYVSFLRTLDTHVGPTVPMDQIQKRFPFPGTLELKAAVVRHAVEAARAKYDAALRDAVTGARVSYAEYAYLAQAITITQETLRYLRQLEATVRGKLAAGTAQTSHVLQTQVEISTLENELVTLRQRRETTRAGLAALLDLPPATLFAEPGIPSPGPFPESVDPLYARALSEQPDIRLAEARADRMAAMIELAEETAYPELSPGLWAMEDVSLATGGSGKDREPFGTKPKAKPDPWFGTKEAYLREAREKERAARDAVAAARDGTLFRVKDAYVQLDTAKRLYELYRDVQISQAEQAYRDASAGYAADRVEFLNVIDALRRWLRFLLDADQAQRDYQQAHARLEAAVGGPVGREAK
jgi:cobalt-zinc-cadmium efflux system outer membrane protein